MHRVAWWVMSSLTAVSLAAGCASRTRTVRTERSVQSPVQTAQAERAPGKTVVVETETVTERRDRHPHGVLSGLVHIVGEILALPFRLIGGLIRLMF